jgi:cysteine synthase A
VGKKGATVGILCDGSERYLHSYYNRNWLRVNGYDIEPAITDIRQFA